MAALGMAAAFGMSIIFIAVQLPLNFGIAHIVLQKYAPDSLWWHMPLCYLCIAMEIGNIVVIKNLTSYLHSDLFQWTAPFIFSFTAVFTRRAAEWSSVPPSAASKMSTVSMGLGVLFMRLAQSAEINDPGQVVVLEVFYAAVSIFLKVSLYSRHSIFSVALSGKCKVRGVPRSERAQGITTVSNVNESIFDTMAFIVLFLSRFLLLPSSITTINFALVFFGCITLQILANTATFVLVSYFEKISIEDFCVSTAFGDFWRRWIYLWVSTMWGLMYMNQITLNVWDSSMRIHVPWK